VAVEKLVDEALSGGGRDNVTVIVINVDHETEEVHHEGMHRCGLGLI